MYPMKNKNTMSDSERKKIVIGFGIGVQLYEVTNEFPSNERDRHLSQIEVK